MLSRIILLIIFSVAGLAYAQEDFKISDLRSGEREVTAPDGYSYTLSQDKIPDLHGPAVSLSLNKPLKITELPPKIMYKFLKKIATEECALINQKPSTQYIIADSNPSVIRYKFKNVKRVAWSYDFHCVP